MPALANARQEAFARALAEGMSATDAMAIAGYSGNPRNSTRLKKNHEIARRVAELQGQAAVRTGITLERLTEMLTEDRDLARSLGQSAAAVAASEKLGKLHGLFVERSENVNTNYNISDEPMSADEWEREHTQH